MPNITLAKFFKEVKNVIGEPERWTKDTNARTGKRGEPVSPLSPLARCWCLAGAMDRARGNLRLTTVPLDAFSLAHEMVPLLKEGYHNFVTFNDLRTTRHKDIVELTNLCIAHAEGAGV